VHNVCFLLLHILTLTSRQTVKDRLTHLVPSTVRFMDETFMNDIVQDAVDYLISTGMYKCSSVYPVIWY